MNDDTVKELVLKHEHAIENLADSVKSLVNSNIETNSRLKEISEYLSKQAVLDTKLSSLDKELADSFKRVHNRIDELENTQNSNSGCKSVQLLAKDVQSYEREIVQLSGSIGDAKITINKLEKTIESLPSRALITWVAGILIVYSVSFGSYVVSSLHKNEMQITKLVEDIAHGYNINKTNR